MQQRFLPKPISYAMLILTGFLFVFCFVTGAALAADGNIVWTISRTFQILGISLAGGAVVGTLICTLFYRLGEKQFATYEEAGRKDGLKVFGLSFLLIFAAWFPAFLAYYPAICAYDIPMQTGQIVSGLYIDHHPLAHTLLLKGAMQLGEHVFGNMNTGIACYALMQMLLLAAAFAFGVRWLYVRGVKRIWLIVVCVFCMLYPFHMYMSISVTKDTIFSAFFLLCLIALWEITKGNMRYMPLFGIAGVGVILFRTNGKYAFLVLLVFQLTAVAAAREKRMLFGKLFLVSAGVFLIGTILLTGIFKALHAEQGDRRELLSLPIQQLARTMVYHGDIGVLPEDDGAMGETDRALVNDFILNEGYKKYRPDFADPVKSNTNTYVARYRAKDFLTTYVGLFLRFPGEYLNAALAVNAGYLYPGDLSHAYVNAQAGQKSGGGYVQTRWDEQTLKERGIYKDSKWPGLWNSLEKWAAENTYLRYPVVKYLFVPGIWIWLYLLLVEWRFIRRRFADCLPFTLIFGYFLTLLLGPTVQLRYLYPVMISFPFLFLCTQDAMREEVR